MEKFMTFDPLDPLDLCIMVDPNYDTAVDELTAHTENAAIGRDTYLSEAYETEIGADQFKAEDDEEAISTAEYIEEMKGYPRVWEIYELDELLRDKRCIY